MKRATETRANPRSLAVLFVALAALSGCEEALSTDQATTDGADIAAQANEPIELFPGYNSDKGETVEAPEAFNTVEAGLWDGRPSLGGTWVAHPDVTKPERVVIKNPKNNKSTTGALFRRERDLPGPALQLSSEAAEKLGILPGAPTQVQVTALRRKPVEETAPEPEETPQTEVAEEKPADTAQQADAPADTAETEQPAKRKWWQKKETAAAAGAATAATAAATDTAAEAVEEVTETAAQAAPAPTLTDPEVTPPEEKPAKRKWWQKKEPDAITETPLDPIEGAAAAIEAAEPTPVAATAAATEGTAQRGLTKPFVQVGTFNVEANAQSAVSKIERNGLSASIRELKTDDKTVWRVLVGPAQTRAERNAIQSDVKDLGFSDAFTVKN